MNIRSKVRMALQVMKEEELPVWSPVRTRLTLCEDRLRRLTPELKRLREQVVKLTIENDNLRSDKGKLKEQLVKLKKGPET